MFYIQPSYIQFIKLKINSSTFNSAQLSGAATASFLIKKDFLENFTKFRGPVSDFSFFRKETPTSVFSCKFCKIFMKTFFYRTPPVAASDSVPCHKWLTWNKDFWDFRNTELELQSFSGIDLGKRVAKSLVNFKLKIKIYAAIQRCVWEEVFGKYSAICFATLLKSHFRMDVLL